MALIGISGKLGSGKDTVGSIIQYLTSEYRDKYEYADWSDRVNNYGSDPHSSFINKKFAGKLKAVGSLLTGIPIEKFEDQEFKKTDLPNEWVYVENGYAARNMTVRDFLQKLGTEAMRNGLHTNVWVNALFADYKPQDAPYKHLGDLLEDKHHGVLNNPNWILTDMRFPNELESVVERGGITIRVNRKIKIGGEDYGFTHVDVKQAVKDGIMAAEHPSETALDDAEFKYTIENNGTIQDLVEEVKRILTIEKIIN
jgi:hypothetical protein